MKVSDVMVRDVVTCTAETMADSIACSMWNNDCGCIPVIDEHGAPVGMVTDRDIAVAAALQRRPLWDIHAKDITHGRTVICCSPGDDIHKAMDKMQKNSVRRLPVVNDDWQLVGIVTMGDIMAFTRSSSNAELPVTDTLRLLQSVSGHHVPQQHAMVS